MSILYIFSGYPGTIQSVTTSDSEINVISLKNDIESQICLNIFDFDLYFKGKKIYKIKASDTSLNTQLQLLSLPIENSVIIDIFFESIQQFYYKKMRKNSSVFEALLEISKMSNNNELFQIQYKIYSNNSEISINSKISETMSILMKPISEDFITINLKLPINQTLAFKCSVLLLVNDLKSFIGLYLSLNPMKITVKYGDNALTEGTLESNNIEDDDFLFVTIVKNSKRFIYFINNQFTEVFERKPNQENCEVKKGLNWKFVCKSYRCEDRDKISIFRSGYGYFEKGAENTRIKCCKCGTVTREYMEIFFFECIYHLQGFEYGQEIIRGPTTCTTPQSYFGQSDVLFLKVYKLVHDFYLLNKIILNI